jgi:hypothetical protein
MVSHDALACNGGVHVLVPGKLLLFTAQAPLRADQAWVDVSETVRPMARGFSATFIATPGATTLFLRCGCGGEELQGRVGSLVAGG